MRPASWSASCYALALAAATFVFLFAPREAGAVPSFARKYHTSCLTCHTIYPMLNPFGEAFRRDGYRFPSQNGSVDSDAAAAGTIALGQEEYKKTFPNSVWPGKIADSFPLSVMMNGEVAVNLPKSDAYAGAGNTFTWGGIAGEVHLFAAGSFDDNFTYFVQLTLPDGETPDIETAYVLWNDIFGPRHLINLWVGRLFAPQLNSYGLHSSYLSDAVGPAVSVVGLYNPSGSFVLGQGHADGIELNGIIAHRLGWSFGWLMSSAASGLPTPFAQDIYAHIGVKSGGVALDGEGKWGPNAPDPDKPWAEKAITLDAFGYRGVGILDNGTGTIDGGTENPIAARDTFYAFGGTLRAQWDSLTLTSSAQVERHARAYPGTPATGGPKGAVINGAPDTTPATAIVGHAELTYVIFPWLVPGVRAEYTNVTREGAGNGQLLRVMPGIATLLRPNVRVVLTGDLEWAKGLPVIGSWDPAGGAVTPKSADATAPVKAEQLTITANVAF